MARKYSHIKIRDSDCSAPVERFYVHGFRGGYVGVRFAQHERESVRVTTFTLSASDTDELIEAIERARNEAPVY